MLVSVTSAGWLVAVRWIRSEKTPQSCEKATKTGQPSVVVVVVVVEDAQRRDLGR